jgi:hypothetical protein
MIPVKTAIGQQVVKDRSVQLTPRQRAALILVDGKRSLAVVLAETSAAGVCRADLERLFELELIESGCVAAESAEPKPSPQERYAAAYPIATRLTSTLGLRGVRLNLAVEGSTCYEDLLAVASRIREAVGSDKYAPLQAALGHS